MNCAEVQEQTRNFLEDLIPEDQRKDFRAHSSVCANCEAFIQRQDHIAADLRRSWVSTPEFDLRALTAAALALKHQQAKKAEWQRPVLAALLVLLGMVLWQERGLLIRQEKTAKKPLVQEAAKRSVEIKESGENQTSSAARSLKSLKKLSTNLEKKAQKVTAEKETPPVLSPNLIAAVESPIISVSSVPEKQKPAPYTGKACIEDQCTEMIVT